MEKITNPDILAWATAVDVQEKLGALSHEGVSDAERRLMHEAIVYDRVFLITTAIGASLLELNNNPANDRQLIQTTLTRVDKFERRLNGEDVDEAGSYLNFREIIKFVRSQNPKPGADTRVVNILLRSSQYSPSPDGRYTAGLYITHINNLVSTKSDVPSETPWMERWVVDMRVLQDAYHDGSLRRINGLSDKRLKILKALINYWRGEDELESSASELSQNNLIR